MAQAVSRPKMVTGRKECAGPIAYVPYAPSRPSTPLLDTSKGMDPTTSTDNHVVLYCETGILPVARCHDVTTN